MAQTTMLSALTPNKDNHTIHVRVGRIWGAINKKTNTWSHTNIILLDEQENHIMATIPNNQNQFYLPLLKEQRVYAISYLKVVPRHPLYRSFHRDFVIKFFYKTKIEEIPDTGVIPPYKFDLQPFDVGMVLSHGQLEYNSDDGGKKMDVLMNESATSDQYFTPTGDIIQEIPIRSLLQTVIPTGTQLVRCICRAKILAILDKKGWFYTSCPTCPRELQPLAGKYYCLACDEEPPLLTPRYRILLHVADESGFTTITLFDKQAEQLVGIPLQTILAEQGEENMMTPTPPAINSIIGKFCAFQLEITPYNIIQGCNEYTTTRVTEIGGIGSPTNICPASTAAGGPIDVTTTKKRKLTGYNIPC